MPTKEPPFWVNGLLSLLQLWFYVYDVITYIPIHLLVSLCLVTASDNCKMIGTSTCARRSLESHEGDWRAACE